VKGQFENSDNFDAQQKQVTALEERVRAGKEKADALTARLAEAKERVDKRARSEAEWEASTNRTSKLFYPQCAY
jgi:predicted RNase H-like nuclease (RuvC/YqgF family)